MQLYSTNEKIHLAVENLEEVLALSIKLVPGIFYINRYDEKYEIRIPTEKELPEKNFSTNNGRYIFRYNGDVYLRRSLHFSEEYKDPFAEMEGILGFDEEEHIFHEVRIGVPMSGVERFESPVLQKRWEELRVFMP